MKYRVSVPVYCFVDVEIDADTTDLDDVFNLGCDEASKVLRAVEGEENVNGVTLYFNGINDPECGRYTQWEYDECIENLDAQE